MVQSSGSYIRAFISSKTGRCHHRQLVQFQMMVADTHRQCSNSTGCGSSSSKNVAVDYLQLQREQFAFMAADRRHPFPNAHSHLNLDSWVMHGPFAEKRWRYLSGQLWVRDDGGISLYELSADFAVRSGWLVPINVSSVPNSDR